MTLALDCDVQLSRLQQHGYWSSKQETKTSLSLFRLESIVGNEVHQNLTVNSEHLTSKVFSALVIHISNIK